VLARNDRHLGLGHEGYPPVSQSQGKEGVIPVEHFQWAFGISRIRGASQEMEVTGQDNPFSK
jgi:hypothetical protein